MVEETAGYKLLHYITSTRTNNPNENKIENAILYEPKRHQFLHKLHLMKTKKNQQY